MKKILVVDDSPTLRQQVTQCLRHGGYDSVEAIDGEDALSKLSGISMIICDINMPRMNGIEFVQQQRSNVPVVMLTTEGHAELVEQAKRAGAKAWMVKPFKPDHLLAVVRKLAG